MAGVPIRIGQKFKLIKSINGNIALLCQIAKVSRSGYYAWLRNEAKREQCDMQDSAYAEKILATCKGHMGVWGYRQVTAQLLETEQINSKKVARIMKKFAIQATIRRANPYRNMYKKTQEHETVQNLLNRDFDKQEPERTGGTDITYVRWKSSFVYLSLVKDFADSEALAWKVGLSLKHELVLDTIDLLVKRLGENTKDFLLHSDQGWHYTHPVYRKKLTELNVQQSMSRKGNCIDNAKTETFFGHMKDELDLSSCKTFEEVVLEIDAFMYYYNNVRRMWSKKKMTPVAYRSHLLAVAN